MKTEQEYANLFLENCIFNFTSDEAKNELAEISKNYWSDLTSHLSQYFSHEDREKITVQAAQLLQAKLQSSEPLSTAWNNVVRDFLSNQQWGYKTSREKPVKKLTEDQKISKKLFKYVWAFFQSMIILKIAVYYFGLESADNPQDVSVVWVWFFFALSAGSLAFFAYRNRGDLD